MNVQQATDKANETAAKLETFQEYAVSKMNELEGTLESVKAECAELKKFVMELSAKLSKAIPAA